MLNASVFYFHANAVLLPKEVCEKIFQLHKEMKEAYIDYTTYDGYLLTEDDLKSKLELKGETSKKVRKDIQELLTSIEDAFRDLLGVK